MSTDPDRKEKAELRHVPRIKVYPQPRQTPQQPHISHLLGCDIAPLTITTNVIFISSHHFSVPHFCLSASLTYNIL
jgi:hypothetical protein